MPNSKENEYLGEADTQIAINNKGVAYSIPNSFENIGVYYYDLLIGGEKKPVVDKNSFSIYEGQKSVGLVFTDKENGNAPMTNSVSITGGDDSNKANIDSSTKLLSLNSIPNYQAPIDVGSDNSYELKISSSNSAGTEETNVTITILDSSIEYNQSLNVGVVTQNLGLDTISGTNVYAVSDSNKKVYVYDYNGSSWTQTVWLCSH